MYRYRMTSTGDSSSKYGNCEVCGKHATEVFHQVESRKFNYADKQHYTHNKCHNIFGHKNCLESKRR